MNDNKQQPPKPDRAIPVRVLRLRTPFNFPTGITDTVMGDSTQENRARYVIEYIPSLRHHRVAYYGPSAKVPTTVVMINESWCSWEPVPQ